MLISIVTGHRTVMQDDFKFDNGLVLPAGTRICFPTLPMHLDPENYANPQNFDPFRFVRGGENLSASQIDIKYLS